MDSVFAEGKQGGVRLAGAAGQRAWATGNGVMLAELVSETDGPRMGGGRINEGQGLLRV